MGELTSISWTNHTFNAWWGCEKISPACNNCYAEAWSERVGYTGKPGRAGNVLPILWGPHGQRRLFNERHWQEPLKWDKAAREANTQSLVFVNSMSDTFENRDELREQRAHLYALTARTPWLCYQLLTKRPEHAALLWELAAQNGGNPRRKVWRSNVWLGTTVEDRKYGVPRIDLLRRVGSTRYEAPSQPVVRFLSCEPLLEDLGDIDLSGIDWVIVGGESGTKPRHFDLAWARRLRDQCREKGVAFFVKQLGVNPVGEWGPNPPMVRVDDMTVGPFTRHRLEESRRKNGVWLLRDRKHGAMLEEFPEDLRLRAFPPRYGALAADGLFACEAGAQLGETGEAIT